MGRRKIQIQPIANERKRSATFSKRKMGLFKKAHELGVLCSVDIAVIIFDEQKGRYATLHEYGSTSVDDIVRRHLQFDGHKDIKTAADFASEINLGTEEDMSMNTSESQVADHSLAGYGPDLASTSIFAPYSNGPGFQPSNAVPEHSGLHITTGMTHGHIYQGAGNWAAANPYQAFFGGEFDYAASF